MNQIDWKDDRGRWFRILVLDETDPEPCYGLVIGPPLELERLDLGEERYIRFHNELFNRGILTWDDARRNLPEVEGALKATLRVDAGLVMEAYRGGND